MKPFISPREKKLLMVRRRRQAGSPRWGGPVCVDSTRGAASPPGGARRLALGLPAPAPPPLQVVIPLQAIANVAIVYLDEFTPAAESWFT